MKSLAASLVKAQAEIDGAVKSSYNPAFKTRYADLESVISAVRPALANHGLAFVQEVSEREAGGLFIETVILHETGEMFRCGKLPIPVNKQDAQAYGSAISYGKRYSLAAAFGVPQTDDDGEAASQRPAAAPAAPAQPVSPVEANLILDSLREAALEGAAALTERFKKTPKGAAKNAVWAGHGDSLKAAAAKVDAEHKASAT
jgi:hypothetical protein